MVQPDAELLEYFPRYSALDTRLPPRDYFWGVMFALRPEFCEELIAEAQQKRAEAGVRKTQASTLLNVGITKEWAQALLARPFTSSKYPSLHASSHSESISSSTSCCRV